jgi:membrane protease YdiL (CAAX protease family)
VIGLLGVVAVVGLFRLVGSGTPYEPSFGDFVIVPLGEEGLFRGFLLVVLLTLFRRRLAQSRAVSSAVVVSAIALGVGHLGNLNYVSAQFVLLQFVLLQVVAATVFGLLAGWVKVRTDSLIGPVLLHAAMNIVAVA